MFKEDQREWEDFVHQTKWVLIQMLEKYLLHYNSCHYCQWTVSILTIIVGGDTNISTVCFILVARTQNG